MMPDEVQKSHLVSKILVVAAVAQKELGKQTVNRRPRELRDENRSHLRCCTSRMPAGAPDRVCWSRSAARAATTKLFQVFSDFCDLFSSAAAVASAVANLSCLDLLLLVVVLLVVVMLACCAASSASSSESLSSAGDDTATKAVPAPCSAEKQAQQYQQQQQQQCQSQCLHKLSLTQPADFVSADL